VGLKGEIIEASYLVISLPEKDNIREGEEG